MKKKSYKKYLNSTIATALVATSVIGTSTVASAATNYPDVQETDYFYQAVKIFSERGAITGFPDGTFKPYENVSRGQMAVILAKVLNLETTNVEDPGFIDVPKTHPYYGAIAALYKAGLVSGHTDRTFRPQEPLSRYHMALILSKAFKFSAKNPNSLPFTDVHPNYREFVAALYELGITVGISNTTFGGVENLSRGQFVQFLLKAEEVRKKLENENTTPTPIITPPRDTIAPVISVVNKFVLPGQILSASSNEVGTFYLTTLSTKPSSIRQLEENSLLKSPIPTKEIYQNYSLDDLPLGTYYLYAVDNTGNISDAQLVITDPELYILEKIDELSMYTYGKKESELDGDFIEITDDEKSLEILKRAYVILMAMINYADLPSIGLPTPVPTIQSEIESIASLQAVEPLKLDESDPVIPGIDIEMLAEKFIHVLMGIQFNNLIDFTYFDFTIPLSEISPAIELPVTEGPTLFSAEITEQEILTPELYASKLDSTLKILSGLVKFVNEENTELKQFDSEIVPLINYALPYLYIYLIDSQFNPYTSILQVAEAGDEETYPDLSMLLDDLSLEHIENFYEFKFDNETKLQILESFKTYLYNEEFITLIINRVFKDPSSSELELIDSIDDIVNLEALLDEIGLIPPDIGEEELEEQVEYLKQELNNFIEDFIDFNLYLTYLLNVDHLSSIDSKFNKAIDLLKEKNPVYEFKYPIPYAGSIDIYSDAFTDSGSYEWDREVNPFVEWWHSYDAGLLGYSYLVVLYDRNTEQLHWVVKDISRLTQDIEEGASDKAGEVVVGYQLPEDENGRPVRNDIVLEVFLLNTSTVDFSDLETKDYSSIYNKIREHIVASGSLQSLETLQTTEITVPVVDENDVNVVDGEPNEQETPADVEEGEEVPVGDGETQEPVSEDDVDPVGEQSNSGAPTDENENTESTPTDIVSYRDTIDFGVNFVLVDGVVKIV